MYRRNNSFTNGVDFGFWFWFWFLLQSKTSQRASPPKEFASLNVTAIEHCNNVTSTTDFQSDFDQAPKPLKTLDLRLEEVAHIRSVLTKVELEAMPIDSTFRDSISTGKVGIRKLRLYNLITFKAKWFWPGSRTLAWYETRIIMIYVRFLTMKIHWDCHSFCWYLSVFILPLLTEN